MTGAAAPTGAEAVAAVAMGAWSVSDALAGCLERVGEREAAVQAFRILDADGARARAKELDDQPGGALKGLVLGVKDVIDTADLPTGYGTPLFADHQPSSDAAAVATVRAAGAVVLGKTESTELAMFQPTRTRNPIDPTRTPGGSSSGSAAAVADGMVHAAFGTQTAGSVVRPAAYCGVYGFKPTRGWTSTEGVLLLAESLDTLGLLARSVSDLALLHSVLASPAAPGATRRRRVARPGSAPTVAVLAAEEWATADADVREALDAVAGRLADAGWRVGEMKMPASWRGLPAVHEVVMAAEAAKNLRALLGDRVSQLSESAQAIVGRGELLRAAEYFAALSARDEALRELAALSVGADLVLSPSATGVAPEGLPTGDPVFCRPWTLLGLPACNVPAYERADRLPVGVQLIGTTFDDGTFLEHLASAETVLGRKGHAP